MTLAEKIDLISGVDGFYERGVPRLGVPRLKMSDGPVGVRNDGPTTAYPAGVCLASTFDPELAHRFGVAIGRDARARGVHIWLGPGMNISRIPQNGRDFEYLGEDPLVAGETVKAIVQGVQSQGVVATLKHFAANNHENDRMVDSSDVDERTLREIYLRGFEEGVKEGGAWAVMCSYNKINGTYSAENKWLLQTVLKDDWGFQGVVMSDWGAVHSTLPTAQAGLDLEMPSGEFLNENTLEPLLANGRLSQADLDDKVRRILRLTFAMGFDTQTQLDKSIPRNDPENAAVALQIAREGTVLLKNDGLLPLDRAKVKRILVVGPDADPAVTGGGGSAYTTPFNPVSLLKAIKQAAGDGAQVQYLPGIGNSFPEALAETKFSGPVKAEYWRGQSTDHAPDVTKEESAIDFDWTAPASRPIPGNQPFVARWTADVHVPNAGTYLLMMRSRGSLEAEVDGKRIGDLPGNFVAVTGSEPVTFKTAGDHQLRVTFRARRGGVVQVALVPLEGAMNRELPPGSVESADVVLAAVGFNPGSESEGRDRPFELPFAQELLLKTITSRSSKVVVLNHSGAGVDMTAWLGRSAAVLQDWYPGENGNQAVAEILFGDTNPSGKLPVTFPRSLKGTYYASAYPPKDHHLAYSEGLLVGYRWFDTEHRKPLFAFGFGLSYTTFKLGGLELRHSGEEWLADVKVTNSGRRDGAETVQLYVGKKDSVVPRPARELKAYQRVELRAGETKTVTLHVPDRWLAYWNTGAHRWDLEQGPYQVYVGTSSENLPLRGELEFGR